MSERRQDYQRFLESGGWLPHPDGQRWMHSRKSDGWISFQEAVERELHSRQDQPGQQTFVPDPPRSPRSPRPRLPAAHQGVYRRDPAGIVWFRWRSSRPLPEPFRITSLSGSEMEIDDATWESWPEIEPPPEAPPAPGGGPPKPMQPPDDSYSPYRSVEMGYLVFAGVLAASVAAGYLLGRMRHG